MSTTACGRGATTAWGGDVVRDGVDAANELDECVRRGHSESRFYPVDKLPRLHSPHTCFHISPQLVASRFASGTPGLYHLRNTGVELICQRTGPYVAATAANTTCPCLHGIGASKDPETGAPCPPNASTTSYCAKCNEHEGYFDFGKSGVCARRPVCSCQKGLPADRDADCSENANKCKRCNATGLASSANTTVPVVYTLRPDLSCRMSSCLLGVPPTGTQWTGVNGALRPINSSTLIANGETATLKCAGVGGGAGAGGGTPPHRWNAAPSNLVEAVAVCEQGRLHYPDGERVLKCEENYCDCPGQGAAVSGVGCPNTNTGSWTCVTGCTTGWSGPTCETPSPCAPLLAALPENARYAPTSICAQLPLNETLRHNVGCELECIGTGLAYLHRTGFRPVSDRFQTGFRPVSDRFHTGCILHVTV